MSSDPEIPAALPPRYVPPEPLNHAEVRPGPVAPSPSPTDAAWVAIGRDLDETLQATRDLFRIVRYPYQDPVWPRLRPNLLRIEAIMMRALRDQPDDPVAAITLQEVQAWLGRKRPGAMA